MLEIFFKNPITLWFSRLFRSIILMIKYRNKNLKIGYLSNTINVKFGNYNTLYSNVVVTNSELGDYIYISENTVINNAKIGSFCSIASNVKIGLGAHPTNYISTHPAFFSTKEQCQVSFVKKDLFTETIDIHIGNDVWIGENALILDNVNIGDGAIIAAGAVVNKDVGAYEIFGGVPAKLIKKRFSDKEIEFLLRIKWWDKDISEIMKNAELFCRPSNWFKFYGKN